MTTEFYQLSVEKHGLLIKQELWRHIADYIMPAYLACLAEFVFRCLQHTAKVKTDLTIAMNSLTFALLKITTHRSWLRKTTLWQLFGKRRGNEIRCMLTIIELIKSARFRSRIHTWQGLACFITTTKLRSSWLVTRGSAQPFKRQARAHYTLWLRLHNSTGMFVLVSVLFSFEDLVMWKGP